jgi:hypothetical protein
MSNQRDWCNRRITVQSEDACGEDLGTPVRSIGRVNFPSVDGIQMNAVAKLRFVLFGLPSRRPRSLEVLSDPST